LKAQPPFNMFSNALFHASWNRLASSICRCSCALIASIILLGRSTFCRVRALYSFVNTKDRFIVTSNLFGPSALSVVGSAAW
jgi:hypothetical protein